jgi:hypothetical protein
LAAKVSDNAKEVKKVFMTRNKRLNVSAKVAEVR